MHPNFIKQVATFHDICAVGTLSNTAAIPILATMGMHACPVPTALLSNHTQYPQFSYLDLTEEMKNIISLWERLPLSFDGIYTGFLGSTQQMEIITGFIHRYRGPHTLVVVDPVFADNGALYATYTPQTVDAMRRFICHADVVVPNLTESSFLLGEAYHAFPGTAQIKQQLTALSAKGPSRVVITGCFKEGHPSCTYSYGYDAAEGSFWEVETPYLEAHYPGTGDVYASVLTGRLMGGHSLPQAMSTAAHFVLQAIKTSLQHRATPYDSVMIEHVLHLLHRTASPALFTRL